MALFKVWECKIVVASDAEIPDGFDWSLSYAAISAIEAHGIGVLSCFSGWGGTLTETQTEVVGENCRRILYDK